MDDDNAAEFTFTRAAVFSPAIDRLVLAIWELGGKKELYSNIERLKGLPPDEFESELRGILERLRSSGSEDV